MQAGSEVATVESEVAIALSIIVPVYDQADAIVGNVRLIRERVAEGMDDPFEIIVVSDGSVDGTAERMLESEMPGVKVLYYDRNLGKGYAVKTGAREARGRWVGYIDADLDLDPAALPGFVAAGEREGHDFVIGSKRHPDSRVHYPRARVISSWLYQQLVRVLFRLDVRDTQVGIKVFRGEIAKEVMPLLLVKRYAFDIELLAVSRAFGYGDVKEMPVKLDYQFTGSGVRSLAVLNALFDTMAVFYRLRILGHYQRRLAANRAFGWTPPAGFAPTVSVITERDPIKRRLEVEQSDGEVIAFLAPDARPSANWLSSTTPFFARPEIAAVVTPQLSPHGGSVGERGAAAVSESRIGAGSLNYRFKPGAMRFVSDFPARSLLVLRDRYLSLAPGTPPEEIVVRLGAAGGRTLYMPDASVTVPPARLFHPHIRRIAAYGRARGVLTRQRGLRAAGASTLGLLALCAWAFFGWLLAPLGPVVDALWLGTWIAYLCAIALASFFGGLRFHSLKVGAVMACALPYTHAVYIATFVTGFLRREGV